MKFCPKCLSDLEHITTELLFCNYCGYFYYRKDKLRVTNDPLKKAYNSSATPIDYSKFVPTLQKLTIKEGEAAAKICRKNSINKRELLRNAITTASKILETIDYKSTIPSTSTP